MSHLRGLSRPEHVETEFQRARPRLVGIAYGIIGDLGEAEDVVQEAWLRLSRTEGVVDVTGWLVVATSRLALDVMRSARKRREDYVGPWLPEPVVSTEEGPEDRVTLADSVNMAMLVVLETLSPAERTAFVLHEVFGLPFTEIAEVVGRTPASVRQLASRARKHVRERSPRFEADPARQREVATAFLAACDGGDVEAMLRLLDPDVVLLSDGGGMVRAALRPVVGADKVARFLAGIRAKWPTRVLRPVVVNGFSGFVMVHDEKLIAVYSITVADGRVTAINAVLHPTKLARASTLITKEK
ncbi:RNA polymerase sigma factor SigJ [Allokutzneria sp. NRRL B-24872]|uniref:RNA polymerase sigma factor SigJ n=1 Tax=Allokutzneria sp. NRRL B-24872 TaxID=1137961 RepID=UPI000A3BE86B|nr:RNA polymerase sigma factor SigJ [Allokutzneria sp. NRRL B-24872]